MLNNDQEPIADEMQAPEVSDDLFEKLKEKKAKGIWKGEVERIEIKEHSLNKGKHYYEIEDLAKRTIVCTSCPIRHGGILEAKHLEHYKVEKGILYFKGRAINEIP